MPTRSAAGVPWLTLAELPAPLRTPSFVLEPLDEQHAELDYDALMSCRERLRLELDWRGWPPEGFTLDENRVDLRRHHAELESREGFTYTVLRPDALRCLGCVYLEPCEEIGGGQLAYWLVDDALDSEAELLGAVVRWAHTAFELDRIVVPLRAENARSIEVARKLGLTPWTAHEDELLRNHVCFSSTTAQPD